MHQRVQAVDFKILFYLNKAWQMHGIVMEAEKMRGAMAVRAAEAGDFPVGDTGHGSRQLMLQILCGADGDAPHPFRFLPEPVNVPVHSFSEPAVPCHALVQIFPG